MRLQLLGGSYYTRSSIASAVRSVNYFPERNPKNSVSQGTLYQRPGLVPLVNDPGNLAPARCTYRASNGDGYMVIGQMVYYVTPQWALVPLGKLPQAMATPVRMTDNGETILLVDGGNIGYTIDLASRAFSALDDPDGFFTAGATCDTIDGFVLWSVPGTRQFKSTLDNQITPFDDTYVASKADYPDPLMALIVNRHEILLIGQLKSEIWYDAGNTGFPFAELPGAYIEHGTCAPYSVASSDISVFWLGQDLQGVGFVFRQRGYDTRIISNHALSVVIRKMADAGTIADAIGYTYSQDGHAFYVLCFPTGNQTWVFDDSIGEPEEAWHQRCWTDGNGNLQRDRSNCGAFLYGKNVVGDWENGTLYAQDLNTYTDTVLGTVYPLTCIRGFQHIPTGQVDLQGQQITALGQRVMYSSFVLDCQSGEGAGGPADADGVPTADQIGLRYSDDRGRSFTPNYVLQSNGTPGEYITQPKWSNLGSARDRIFEVSHSINGPVAINGAWTQLTMQAT